MKPVDLRISVFNGGWNLPIWSAIELGFFAHEGINLIVNYTKNSLEMIKGFHTGEFEMIFCSADNIIAYQANRAEIPIEGKPDARIFLSGDSGFLSIVSSPEIEKMLNLRGKVIGVDKADTGFAYVLYEALIKSGIELSELQIKEMGSTDRRLMALLDGKCNVTLLRTPYQLIANKHGCHLFSRYQLTVNEYQGTVGAIRLNWLASHRHVLNAFKAAYKLALDWIYAHPHQAKEVLYKYMPDLDALLLNESFENLTNDKFGFDRSMIPNEQGLQGVLQLRNKFSPLMTGCSPISISFKDMII